MLMHNEQMGLYRVEDFSVAAIRSDHGLGHKSMVPLKVSARTPFLEERDQESLEKKGGERKKNKDTG